jgi:hypothetical protein
MNSAIVPKRNAVIALKPFEPAHDPIHFGAGWEQPETPGGGEGVSQSIPIERSSIFNLPRRKLRA